MALLYTNGFEAFPVDMPYAAGTTAAMQTLSATGMTFPAISRYVNSYPTVMTARYPGGYCFNGDNVCFGNSNNQGYQNKNCMYQVAYKIAKYNNGSAACSVGGGVTFGFAGRPSRFGIYVGGQSTSLTSLSFGYALPGLGTANSSNTGIIISLMPPTNGMFTSMKFYAGNTLTSGAAALLVNLAQPFVADTWHYYEVALKPGDNTTTQFIVEFYVDGVLQYTSSTYTWGAAAQSTTTGLWCGVGNNAYDSTTVQSDIYNGKMFDVDDFYVSDRTGNHNNSVFLTELQIRKRSIKDSSVQSIPVGATTNAEAISTMANKDVTTIPAIKTVSSGFTSTSDLYELVGPKGGDMPFFGSVRAATYYARVNRTGVRFSNVTLQISNGVTPIDVGIIGNPVPMDAPPLSMFMLDTNPYTNSLFTIAEANTYKIGIRKVV